MDVIDVDRWYALDVMIEPGAREAVGYALMEGGSPGTEYNELSAELGRVTAYFSSIPDWEAIRREVSESLRIYNLPTSAVRDMRLREVANQDWLAEWKKTWQPIELGDRFVVAPPWTDVSNVHGRIVIRIEPGMAFGTGTHESTRLCLTAIEKHFEGGSFLDVGTGTGILAIAAAKLFPRATVSAYDIDAEVVAIARENALLNGVTSGIDFYVGSIDDTTRSADLVCANLTAPVILELLPALVGTSCGRLILSGVLESQVETILENLRQIGINDLVEVLQDGEWVALVV